MSNFLLINKEIIEKYYLENLVNLNNKSSLTSYQLNLSITNLRKNFCNVFGFKNWEKVLIFPNNFYAKQTILNSLNLNQEWFIYSDEEKYFEKNKFFFKTNFENLNNFEDLQNSNKNVLFWITKVKNFSNLQKNIKKWKDNKNLKIFISVEEILDKNEWQNIWSYVDFFLFNPSKILNLYGSSILYFDETTNLEPFYLGSNSVNFLSKNTFSLKKNYEAFECGTQNFILLLILENFFYFLNKKR